MNTLRNLGFFLLLSLLCSNGAFLFAQSKNKQEASIHLERCVVNNDDFAQKRILDLYFIVENGHKKDAALVFTLDLPEHVTLMFGSLVRTVGPIKPHYTESVYYKLLVNNSFPGDEIPLEACITDENGEIIASYLVKVDVKKASTLAWITRKTDNQKQDSQSPRDTTESNSKQRCPKGDVVQQDYTKKKSAEKKNGEAEYQMGLCYMDGKGVQKDEKQAFLCFEKAALQGHADAQCKLGDCYYWAKGVTQDYTRAAKWYRKSAEQGNHDAQTMLGICYCFGQGVTKSDYSSFLWMLKGAEGGNAVAQYLVASDYEYGTGTLKNPKTAFEWFQKSAEQGYDAAQCRMGLYYELGTDVQKDYEKAVQWYRKAAEQGNGAGYYALGSCYEKGLGVDKNMGQALSLYRKSVKKDHPAAYYAMGRFYEEGLGVQKNLETAKSWYSKAATKGVYDAKKALDRVNQKLLPSREGTVEKIWLEQDVSSNSGEKGMRIHTNIQINGAKGSNFKVYAYFFDENKNYLSNGVEGYRSSNGQPLVVTTVKPDYNRSVWNDLSLFIPYNALPMVKPNKTYYVAIELYDIEKKDWLKGWEFKYASFKGSALNVTPNVTHNQPSKSKNGGVPYMDLLLAEEDYYKIPASLQIGPITRSKKEIREVSYQGRTISVCEYFYYSDDNHWLSLEIRECAACNGKGLCPYGNYAPFTGWFCALRNCTANDRTCRKCKGTGTSHDLSAVNKLTGMQCSSINGITNVYYNPLWHGGSITPVSTGGNSGSSNDYQSSGSNSAGRQCKGCGGTGWCHMCQGKGWYKNQYNSNIYDCPACNHTGQCKVCHGKGVIK